ncbi:MAG: pentapeptide repeat-containing protein [Alphaproteobacteria bacterium]|nr:pentapeptide repeat-containing protein [Alphaproteobacteria bacterium]
MTSDKDLFQQIMTDMALKNLPVADGIAQWDSYVDGLGRPADLRGVNFPLLKDNPYGYDLDGVPGLNLRGAIMDGADLSSFSNFRGADFQGASLKNVEFRVGDFTASDIHWNADERRWSPEKESGKLRAAIAKQMSNIANVPDETISAYLAAHTDAELDAVYHHPENPPPRNSKTFQATLESGIGHTSASIQGNKGWSAVGGPGLSDFSGDFNLASIGASIGLNAPLSRFGVLPAENEASLGFRVGFNNASGSNGAHDLHISTFTTDVYGQAAFPLSDKVRLTTSAGVGFWQSDSSVTDNTLNDSVVTAHVNELAYMGNAGLDTRKFAAGMEYRNTLHDNKSDLSTSNGPALSGSLTWKITEDLRVSLEGEKGAGGSWGLKGVPELQNSVEAPKSIKLGLDLRF